MRVVRLVAFGIAAIAAITTFALLGPEDPPVFQPVVVEGNVELVNQAVADFQTNAENAGEDKDLQIIANGWIARDLLFIQTNQLDALSDQISVLSAQAAANSQAGRPDDRIAVLLLIGVLTLAFHGATVAFAPTNEEAAGAEPLHNSTPTVETDKAGQ